MAPLDPFTLVTGIASLLGFALQMFDIFPRFAKVRQALFFFVLGIFVGSVVRAIEPAAIRVSFQLGGFAVLIAVFGAVIVLLLVIAATTSTPQKRVEFLGASGIGFLAFIFVLMFGGILSGAAESPAMEKQRLTISELQQLSEGALKLKDFERAAMHLRTIEARVQGDPELKAIVQQRIRDVELQALK